MTGFTGQQDSVDNGVPLIKKKDVLWFSKNAFFLYVYIACMDVMCEMCVFACVCVTEH